MDNNKEPRKIEIVSEYKAGQVIVGAKVFISTEDAKAILMHTALKDATLETTEGDENRAENLQMLHESRVILRQFAKAILFSPVNLDITLANIASKYL